MAGDGYRGKTVVVTGGTGFIGSRLAERLALEEGAVVRVLVRDWRRATWVSRADIALFQGDIQDPGGLRALLAGADTVFHCIGIGSTPEVCRRVNAGGTGNLVQAAGKAGVRRIVYLSTVGVHGPRLTQGLDESAPFRLLGNGYADSKIEAEEVFVQQSSRFGLEGTVIRPTYVWGPNSAHFTLAPIEQMLRGWFALVDRGRGACNAVHVDNVVDLALLAGVHPRAMGEAFLVRDPDLHCWADFFGRYAAFLGKSLGEFPSISSGFSLGRSIGGALQRRLIRGQERLRGPVPRWAPKYPLLTRYGLKAPRKALRRAERAIDRWFPGSRYGWWDLAKYSSPGFISIEKAQRLLGFSPRTTVDAGMRDTEFWLRDQGYLPGPGSEPRPDGSRGMRPR